MLSWPLSNDNEMTDPKFDQDYPERVQGIYLVLYLHVLCEVMLLRKLSYQAALQVQKKSKKRSDQRNFRRDKKDLLNRMILYNVSMNSLVCSGWTEYQEFFGMVRDHHRVEDQRDDMAAGIQQLYEMVETDHRELEESRDRNVSYVGALLLPFAILSGLLGMNNFDGELFYETSAQSLECIANPRDLPYIISIFTAKRVFLISSIAAILLLFHFGEGRLKELLYGKLKKFWDFINSKFLYIQEALYALLLFILFYSLSTD
jgi:hypothetical protein